MRTRHFFPSLLLIVSMCTSAHGQFSVSLGLSDVYIPPQSDRLMNWAGTYLADVGIAYDINPRLSIVGSVQYGRLTFRPGGIAVAVVPEIAGMITETGPGHLLAITAGPQLVLSPGPISVVLNARIGLSHVITGPITIIGWDMGHEDFRYLVYHRPKTASTGFCAGLGTGIIARIVDEVAIGVDGSIIVGAIGGSTGSFVASVGGRILFFFR